LFVIGIVIVLRFSMIEAWVSDGANGVDNELIVK